MIQGMKADCILKDDIMMNPREELKQLKLERKASVKERDLYRRQKRKDKRSQAY